MFTCSGFDNSVQIVAYFFRYVDDTAICDDLDSGCPIIISRQFVNDPENDAINPSQLLNDCLNQFTKTTKHIIWHVSRWIWEIDGGIDMRNNICSAVVQNRQRPEEITPRNAHQHSFVVLLFKTI